METPLFMSSTIQGETTFLLAGGYKMNVLEGNNIGERTADIIKFNGVNKVWITDNNQTTMELTRAGHITIPISFSNHLDFLIGKKY